jgi:predicted ATPase
MRREPDEGRRVVEDWIIMAKEFVLPLLISGAQFQLGWALAETGHAKEGVGEMREGIAAISATGAAMGMPYFLCILARACGDAGEAGEGLEQIERALGIAESGAKYQLPELLRTKGELLLRLNPRDEAAEGWFQQSLTTAREEGAKSNELRAALSVARLYRAQARNEEAQELLSPVYAWFTEGFDTRDLVEAKALLDQLR